MKRFNFFSFSVLVFSLVTLQAHGNKPGMAKLKISTGEIVIDYIAPALNGRDLETMAASLEGRPWRMGADKPTIMQTPQALSFGDSRLEAGNYNLRARLDASGSWWLQAYGADRQLKGEVALSRSTAQNAEENMLISLNGSPADIQFQLQWGKLVLRGKFSVS